MNGILSDRRGKAKEKCGVREVKGRGRGEERWGGRGLVGRGGVGDREVGGRCSVGWNWDGG